MCHCDDIVNSITTNVNSEMKENVRLPESVFEQLTLELSLQDTVIVAALR